MLPIERRIPRNLGGTDTLFDDAPIVGTVEFTDGIVAFGPAMMTLFILNNVIPQKHSWVSLLAACLVGLFGVLFLLVKPNHLSLSEWLKNYREFKKRPTHIQKQFATDGGLDRHGVPVTSSPDTRKFTKVEKVYPAANAVQRTDGRMVGAVQCGGVNLDTATGTEWEMYAEQLADWFNRQVDYDVQFYMPMRQFDPTDQMETYLNRAGDEDIATNPVLSQYVQDRAAWMQATAAQSFIREFYVFFTVSRREVLTDEFKKGDFERNLKNMPGGSAVEDFMKGLRGTDNASAISESEVIDRQLRELERRRSDILGGLSLGGDNKTTPVDGDTLGVLLKEYWEGVTVREDEAENFVRRKPFVTGGDDTIAGDS